MIKTRAPIVDNEQLTEQCWRMTLKAPGIASKAKPGQFVSVKIAETNDPLLRRPFTICRCVKLNGSDLGIDIVYKVVGRGTKLMTNLKRGDELDIIGPSGHGFEWERDKTNHVLLAGGIGSACLLMLGEEISRAGAEHDLKLYILLGAETSKNLILEKEFAALNGKVMVSTNDGTRGYHGLVTEMLEDAINKGEIPSDCTIYTCGPEPMLKVLTPFCQKHHIPAQVSIERRMLCGIGACLVCVCKVNKKGVLKYRDLKSSHIQLSPQEEFGYALACKDGPVFRIDEVIFEE